MRIKFRELTPARIGGALKRRVLDLKDAAAWRNSQFAAENIRRLEKFRNIHRGKRAFIIANGPSLASMDLSPLAGELTFSMNRAYLLYPQWGFEPTYYVSINELVIEQFAEDIAALSMPRFVNFNRRALFHHCRDDASLMFLRVGLNLNDYFAGDVTREIASGGTVTYGCLQLAYFMGIHEAVIIGMDHNFAEKGVPNTTEVRSSQVDESHCHPDYFPKGIKWQLPDLYRSELAYALARQAWEADGRQIYDATVDGKCEVFIKKRYSQFAGENRR